MKQLLFGSPGIPTSTEDRTTPNGVRQCRALGLDAMEMEFTHSVSVSKQLATEVRKAAQDSNIVLTCHGQYFVNLASLEKAKQRASIERMLLAARTVGWCGGYSITWHLAFYQGQEKEAVYQQVKTAVQHVVKTLQDEGNTVWIRPETTGKATQWGDVDEVIRLSQDVEQVLPCIDFAHIHARANGKENTYDEFCATLAKIEKGLGKDALKNMHIQVSGMEYTEKGERRHLPLKDKGSKFNYKDLLKAFKEFKLAGVVINESPNIEEDALMLQKMYGAL
ncbi:TIM barrel protein [Candidatus Woesearchaeota archaeon]|nr:TIM barrel protein [Candidatus Woesearchaeota archaeon]